jgi:hypothetical protein
MHCIHLFLLLSNFPPATSVPTRGVMTGVVDGAVPVAMTEIGRPVAAEVATAIVVVIEAMGEVAASAVVGWKDLHI